MDKRGDDGGCCLVVQEVRNTTEVTYVVMTGTRFVGRRKEGSKTKHRLRANEQEGIG